MTPGIRTGSCFLLLCMTPLVSVGCGTTSEADAPRPAIAASGAPLAAPRDPEVPGESCLGVTDRGIWSDLDDKIQIRLPADLTPERVSARVDGARGLLVLAIDGFPRK